MVNWDSNETDDLVDLQTKSIDQTLQPLINQLACLTTNSTTDSLFNQNDLLTNRKKPGRSKRAHILVESVCEAIETFIRQGADIAQDNPEMSDEIMQTIAQIRLNGNEMAETARDFANDPLCAQKRLVMIKASRDLLNTVGRLLSLADMIDINLLLGSIQIVQQDLINLKNSSNQDELTHHFKIYGRNIVELTSQAGRRQADLKDTRLKDELAAARATLKKQSMILYSAAKTLLRHPELSAAQSNHDFVFKEVYDAVDKIHGITTNRISSENIKHLYDEAASLSAALDEMDKQIININPNQFNETRMRSKFESQLENIISAVALMADSESTRPNRRDRIVDECNVLRQALQDLLNAYINNNRNGGVGGGAQIEHATIEMTKMTKNLRRQLRKAVIDHISDSFLETNLPLETMIEIARQGQDEKQLADSVQIFMNASQ